MSEMRELLWKVVELGPRTVLRQHGFKRPGGGSRFVRERSPLRQIVSCRGTWSGVEKTGQLVVSLEQRAEHYTLWSRRSPPVPVDLLYGDPMDAAIAMAAWLEAEGLRELNKDPDLRSLGLEFEQQSTSIVSGVPSSARVWELLGFADEARRVADGHAHVVALRAAAAIASGGDLPF